jgi:hypothetical protein
MVATPDLKEESPRYNLGILQKELKKRSGGLGAAVYFATAASMASPIRAP